jgi:EipB-like
MLENERQLRYCKEKALEVPFSEPRKAIMTHPLLTRALGASMVALALPMAWPALAAGEGIVMAPHRAVYEMSLANARGGTGVSAVAGRMVYELTGSVCEGYTQNMRFVTQMVNQGGNAVVTDLRSSSWEEGSGKRFRFNSSQYRDEKATEVTAGDAARANTTDDNIKVELTKPSKKDLSLPARVYFPVQHSIALVNAAKDAKTIFRADLYDGSEKGEKVYDTVSFIGRQKPPGDNRQLPQVKDAERLDQLAAWPISIGYFEPGSDGKDAVPVYELSFLFFENGVSRKLFIDYGEFAIQGELKEIVFHTPSKCDPK